MAGLIRVEGDRRVFMVVFMGGKTGFGTHDGGWRYGNGSDGVVVSGVGGGGFSGWLRLPGCQ